MDKIKKIFNDITGGDGKVDASDIKHQMGDLGLDDLKDLNFPVTKAEVVSILKKNKVSDALIIAAEKLPDQTFNTLNELKAKLPF